MQNLFMTDLQFFADESAPAAAETASGAETADAGQNDVTDAACAPQEAPSPARKSWEEVRADYKAEFDAEVQAIVQKRLRGAQEKLRAYAAREEDERRAPRCGAKRRSSISARCAGRPESSLRACRISI